MAESITRRTAQEELAALVESGQAFANQVRAVTYKLNGQAYSSTVSALNQFDADLRRTRAVHAAESLPPSPQMVGTTNKEMLTSFGAEDIREGSRMVFGADEEDTWEDYYEVPFHVLDRIRAALSTATPETKP